MNEFSYALIFDVLNAETSAQSTVTVEGFQQKIYVTTGKGSDRYKIVKV